ncbi:MAG: 5'-deoxynucleotidase [Ruminococcaceae bacterium]|nr:5'-deoxynucleotidase [Oscillospiraceae bacterium]
MRKNGFFAMMTRMRNITRWGLMRNNITENLTEHSYDTAVTAHALAVIGKEKFGKDIDPGQIAAVALFHDASEIITGDLPTPVKYNNPAIQTAYKSIEQAAADSLLQMLPGDLRPSYKVLFDFETDDPELYRYVKAADKISAYIKCVEELRGGNDEFRRAAVQTREAIAKMAMPEADYYMEQFAPAFSLSLDELQEEEQ